MLFIEVVSSIQSRQCTLLHSEDSLCVIGDPKPNGQSSPWKLNATL